jgi:hypothetical protein
MRQSVIVQFHPDRPLELPLHADEAAMPNEDARRWLDEQFVANECEPLRASGKVLTADKVLALAQAAGEDSEDLYEQVWREPMLRVAERHGVSSSLMASVAAS